MDAQTPAVFYFRQLPLISDVKVVQILEVGLLPQVTNAETDALTSGRLQVPRR